MTILVIKANPRYKEMSVPGVLGKGLRERIKTATGSNDRVEIEFPLKVELRADTVLEVRVARKEPIEGYTAESFAAYLGDWLNDVLDGPLADKQIIVTVVINRGAEGVWKRNA